MPRPGPRPYECVRRAWHSDRHQPMRGSLIQEIFRVANEVHRPATRKNKEWQEKLPIVVLKAEEIMYSKANSEAEYMDLQTLWDRANDAINTVIRRDDDTPESRDFLHPCIEAALNLGCTPRRASRSQRHSNPGFYLSSSMKETAATSPKIPDNSMAQLGSSTELLPSPPPRPYNLPGCASQLASWYSALATSNPINSGHSKAVSLTPDTFYEQNNSSPGELPFLSKDALLSCQDASLSIPMGTCTWSNFGRVYPLYYSSSQHKASSQLTLENPQGSIGKTAIAASLPCVPPVGELETCFLHNFPDINTTMDASNTSLNFGESSEYPPNSGCDLSLRLGPPSPPYLGSERALAYGVEDVGSSSSCDESKLCDLSPSRARARNFESSLSSPKDKGFDFFHLDTTDEPIESCSSKGSSELEAEFSAAASDEKHKSCIGGSSGDGYICWK